MSTNSETEKILKNIQDKLDLLLIIQLAHLGFNIKEVGKIIGMSSNTIAKLTSNMFSKIPTKK